MPHFLNQTSTTIRERLRQHVSFPVAIRAEGFASEAGGLQHVGRQFIKVNEVYFHLPALQDISLLGFKPELPGAAVWMRTVARGSFQAKLLQTGADFVEVLVEAGNGSSPEWLIIPLHTVISIERAG